MKNKNSKLKRGFTLIELLIVIAIIGLLASIVLAALSKARSQGRDAKRIADINALYNAIELYYDTNHYLPNCNDSGYPGGCDLQNYIVNGSSMDTSLDGIFVQFLVPNYIAKAPKDPINSIQSLNFYSYSGRDAEYPIGSGKRYLFIVATFLENANNPALKSSLFYNDPNAPNNYALGERE